MRGVTNASNETFPNLYFSLNLWATTSYHATSQYPTQANLLAVSLNGKWKLLKDAVFETERQELWVLGKEQKVKGELLVQQVRPHCRELPPCLLSSLRPRGKLQGKLLNVNHSLGLGYTDFGMNVTHSTPS